jgi:integrase
LATKLQYAKILHVLLNRLGAQVPLIALYMQGLRASGAMAPTIGAPCATLRQIRALIGGTDGRIAAAVSLAWRTASRWSDLLGLRGKDFLIVEDLRIVVRWGPTKTNRGCQVSTSSLTVVASIVPMLELVPVLRSLRPNQYFCHVTTDQFRHLLASYPTASNLTAHSIKNGAIDLLAHHALMGHLDPGLIPRVTKHTGTQMLPSVTLGYMRNEVQRAELLETQKVTVWLDPYRPENLLL